MDATDKRPQLPALSYLDLDRAKRDEDAYQNRNTELSQSLPPGKAPSPPYHYPPGPPPPYSHAQGPSISWSGVKSSTYTPPESRRSSREEKDPARPANRQSLPSISEALGVDSQTPFSSAAQPPSLQTTHLPQPASASTSSPSPNSRRSYTMVPPHSHHNSHGPSSNSYQSYPHHSPPDAPPSSLPTAEPPRSTFAPAHEPKPSIHLQSGVPASGPPSHTYSRPSEPLSTYEASASQSAGTMGPTSYPYGYTPYPPRYANHQNRSSSVSSSGPVYQPSAVHAAPPTPSSSWKSESSSRYDDRQGGSGNYGDSVKRHLDFYDLEVALNDISQASGILSDFARRYGDLMHHTQRYGASLSTLPSIVEVDDMILKSRTQLDALVKIRDVILTQQVAYEQRAADQRQQHRLFSEPPPPPPPPPPTQSQPPPPPQTQPDSSQRESEDSGNNGNDKSSNFNSLDAKKRRGRAAPPGRCHSCNRAETPEWRRGPDGARTLCNACGLHYAKLTRKNNNAHKHAAHGNSNLRPKEHPM